MDLTSQFHSQLQTWRPSVSRDQYFESQVKQSTLKIASRLANDVLLKSMDQVFGIFIKQLNIHINP